MYNVPHITSHTPRKEYSHKNKYTNLGHRSHHLNKVISKTTKSYIQLVLINVSLTPSSKAPTGFGCLMALGFRNSKLSSYGHLLKLFSTGHLRILGPPD